MKEFQTEWETRKIKNGEGLYSEQPQAPSFHKQITFCGQKLIVGVHIIVLGNPKLKNTERLYSEQPQAPLFFKKLRSKADCGGPNHTLGVQKTKQKKV